MRRVDGPGFPDGMTTAERRATGRKAPRPVPATAWRPEWHSGECVPGADRIGTGRTPHGSTSGWNGACGRHPGQGGSPRRQAGFPSAKPGDGTPIIPIPAGDEDGSPTQLVTDALYLRVVSIKLRVVSIKGEGSALLGEHSKTRAYTVGISPDNSSISLANDQRQYRVIADGSKGDFWAFNQVQTRRVATNFVDLEGAGNHIKAAHSKTGAFTVGIDGDSSTIALANDQRQYRVIADGSKGDFWAFNQVQTRRVAANIVDPARPAYTWADGMPRVVPIWFHFDGEVITMCSPPRSGPGRDARRIGPGVRGRRAPAPG